MLAKLRTRRPGHGTIVAYLALFVALGGTSVAAVKLKNNSVLSRHIKNGQVQTADVKDRSLSSSDFAPGQLPKGDKGVAGDRGPQGERGAQGDTGSPGSALAYTHVLSDGSLDTTRSKNTIAAFRVLAGAGVYCVDLTVVPKNVVATIDRPNSATQGTLSASLDPGDLAANCPPGYDAKIITTDLAGATGDKAFFASFN